MAQAGDADGLEKYLAVLRPRSKVRDRKRKCSISSDGFDSYAVKSLSYKEALLSRDNLNRTPLFLATKFNHLDCIRVLLNAASQAREGTLKEMLNIEDDCSRLTPLDYAISEAKHETILLFLRSGVDFWAKSNTYFECSIVHLTRLTSGLPFKYMPIFKDVLKVMAELDPKLDLNRAIEINALGEDHCEEDLLLEDFHLLDIRRYYLYRRGSPSSAMHDTLPPIGDPSQGHSDVDMDNAAFALVEGQLVQEQLIEEHEGSDSLEEEGNHPFLDAAALADGTDNRNPEDPAERYETEIMPNGPKRTLLHMAAKYGSIEVLTYLMKMGAQPEGDILHESIEVFDSYHRFRSLMYSWSLSSATLCIKSLLHAGADINHKSRKGDTPMHFALDLGCAPIVEMLLEKRPDITLCDADGKNVLECARGTKFEDMVTHYSKLSRLISPVDRPEIGTSNPLDADQACVVCLTRPKVVILAPCGHKCLCRRCMRILLSMPKEKRLCPLDKIPIGEFLMTIYE